MITTSFWLFVNLFIQNFFKQHILIMFSHLCYFSLSLKQIKAKHTNLKAPQNHKTRKQNETSKNPIRQKKYVQTRQIKVYKNTIGFVLFPNCFWAQGQPLSVMCTQ